MPSTPLLPPGQQQAQVLCEQALTATDSEQRFALIQQALRLYPVHPPALALLLAYYLDQGQSQQALSTAFLLFHRDPLHPLLEQHFIELLVNQQQPQMALAYWMGHSAAKPQTQLQPETWIDTLSQAFNADWAQAIQAAFNNNQQPPQLKQLPGWSAANKAFSRAQAKPPHQAIRLLQQVINEFPLHLPALERLATLESAQNHWGLSASRLELCALMQPANQQRLNQLAKCLARTGRIPAALCLLQRLYELNPQDHHRLNLMAGLYGRLSHEALNRYWGLKLAQAVPIYKKAQLKKGRLQLLILNSTASGAYHYNPEKDLFSTLEGHNNLAQALDPQIHQTLLRVDALASNPGLIQRLPKVDLIYNSITDADRCKQALQRADQLCQKLKVPVINPPQAVLQTTREANHQRLKDCPGVILPKAVNLGECSGPLGDRIRAAAQQHGLKAPIILRAGGFQGGKNMHKIDNLTTLEVSLKQPAEVYLIQYHDVSYTDARAPDLKLYPKYRAFLVAGELYPVNVIVADDYRVHRSNSDPVLQAHPWLADIETDFNHDPAAHLGGSRWQDLKAALNQLELDYLGVDFALATGEDEAGQVVIFEANASMRNRVAEFAKGSVTQNNWAKITHRVHQMFCEKAGVPAWDFKWPQPATPKVGGQS